jgi:hypothetical protein
MKRFEEGVKERLNVENSYFHSLQNISCSWLPNIKITT